MTFKSLSHLSQNSDKQHGKFQIQPLGRGAIHINKLELCQLIMATEVRLVTNVLLPIDGSSYAKVITDFVINHRWAPHTQLRLLHLIEPLADDVYPEAVWERAAANAAKKMLNEVAERISSVLPTLKVTQLIHHGDPRQEILREAAEWPADLILLGSHSSKNVNKTNLGSVSLSVLSKAQAMVIIVRVPQKKIEALATESAAHMHDFKISSGQFSE